MKTFLFLLCFWFATQGSSASTQKRKNYACLRENFQAKLSDKADWDFNSKSFSLSLTCGDLKDPRNMKWITPDGSVKYSTKSCDGKSYLLLDNPVKGGQYICKTPTENVLKTCGHIDYVTHVSVNVNENKARAILLESKNNPLREDATKCISRSSSDCEDRDTLRSGKRILDLTSSQSVEIYCDQHTDGGRWNVFQRRYDGSVDFYRGWSDYRNGFGDPEGEFWLGLETLHQMTSDGRKYELRFDLEKQDGSKYYSVYDGFSIGPESEGYAVNITDYSGGSTSKDFLYHRNMKFSTKDRDQDLVNNYNCARGFRGGWWFKYCASVNLNGNYGDNRPMKGILWKYLTGFYESLKKTEMKFRVKK